MRAQRLLFTRPRFAASLIPICAALLALIAIGLVGLVVVFWRAGSELPRDSVGRDDAGASASPAIDERSRRPAREPKTPMRSM